MWLLVSKAQPDLKFTILGDHKYVVGRQNCDIVIPDASVSRKQAVITMAHYESNVVKSFITPTLTLEDVSKFGTLVNGKPVKNPGGNTVTLKDKDEIKFGGSPASDFRAVYETFMATTSCLEKAPKKSLQKVMCLLGGHLVRDWRPSCDLLIMSKINVTIKVICAINNQKHIVIPQYLDDLHAHLMGHKDKPDPANYLPEVVDQEVPPGVSFHPDVRRVTLLQGIKFYFLSAVQFNKTNLAVSTAGGQPILLEDGTEEDARTMTRDGTVVVSVTKDVLSKLTPSCQKFVKVVFSVLRRKNLRMVTDPEIGWAILTCSTEDFCNPKSAITPGMLSSMASQSLSQMTEMDASQSANVTDVKPGKRIADMMDDERDKDTSIKKVKTEKLSHSDDELSTNNTSAVNNVLLNEVSTGGQTKGNRVELGMSGHDEDRQISGIISSNPQPNNSMTVDNSETPQTATEGAEQRNQTPGKPLPSHSQLDEKIPRNVSPFGKNLASRMKSGEESEKPSVFGRIQIKKKLGGAFAESQNNSRKKATLFNDDDDDNNDVGRSNASCKPENNKRSGNSKRSKLSFSDSEDDESGNGIVEKVAVGQKNARKTSAGSDFEDSVVTATRNNSNVIEDTNSVMNRAELNNDDDESKEDSLHRVTEAPTRGWLNTQHLKSKEKPKPDSSQVEMDIKPNVDLVLGSDGKPLVNLCEVMFTDLVSRPAGSTVNRSPKKQSAGGGKNFKRFKKNKNAGADKLPTIIGGRDLEVYLGNKHKDIEDLFSLGLAQENERQQEERRGKDLFDWDDRKRKTVTKRKR